jgi:hypothetical protein
MRTATATIAHGWDMVHSGRYWYLDGGHSTTITAARRAKYPAIPVSKLGLLGIDCVGFDLNLADYAGCPISPTPWSVSKFVAYCPWPRIPIGEQRAGDFAVFGTAHMAVFTDPGHVLQSFDETHGLLQTTLKGVGRTLTMVLRPPYAPEVPPTPYTPLEGVDMNPCRPTRLYDTRTKPGVRSLFGTGGGKLKAGVPRRFQITNPTGPIPPGAVLVAFSIQTVGPVGGWFHLSPEAGVPDGISTLNETEPIVNGFPVLGLDATGGVTAYSTIDTDLIIQVTAYTPAA